MRYFIRRVAEIGAEEGVSLGAWEDAALSHDQEIGVPFPRTAFPSKSVPIISLSCFRKTELFYNIYSPNIVSNLRKCVLVYCLSSVWLLVQSFHIHVITYTRFRNVDEIVTFCSFTRCTYMVSKRRPFSLKNL